MKCWLLTLFLALAVPFLGRGVTDSLVMTAAPNGDIVIRELQGLAITPPQIVRLGGRSACCVLVRVMYRNNACPTPETPDEVRAEIRLSDFINRVCVKRFFEENVSLKGRSVREIVNWYRSGKVRADVVNAFDAFVKKYETSHLLGYVDTDIEITGISMVTVGSFEEEVSASAD